MKFIKGNYLINFVNMHIFYYFSLTIMLLNVLVVYSQWRVGRGVSLPEAPQTHLLSTIKIMYMCFPGISVILGYSDLGFGGF